MARLSLDQFDVLEMVSRYGLLTTAVVRAVLSVNKSRSATTKFLSRMVGRELLVRTSIRNTSIFRLGPAAKEFVDAPERFYVAPGPQSLERRLAVMRYCCLGRRLLKRLTESDCIDLCPDFPKSELLQPYYFDPGSSKDDHGYLGWLRLVRLQKRPSTVVSELRDELVKRYELGSPFRELIDNGRFLVVLMVYSEGQRNLVRNAVRSRDWAIQANRPAIPIRVHTIPSNFGDFRKARRNG